MRRNAIIEFAIKRKVDDDFGDTGSHSPSILQKPRGAASLRAVGMLYCRP
jgi:hypothetical protein